VRCIATWLGLMVLAGCASTPSDTSVLVPALGSGAEGAGGAAGSAYVLGAGDRLRVIVFGEANLSGEFLVNGAGMVSLPLVGEVPAAGSTLDQFRATLEMRLSDGYLEYPRVSAEVLNYRPFYILGEVANSGEYPYIDGLTVINAVARAGGFTYRANQRVVFIKRADTSAEVEVPLTATVRVMPGDTIRVPERFF